MKDEAKNVFFTSFVIKNEVKKVFMTLFIMDIETKKVFNFTYCYYAI